MEGVKPSPIQLCYVLFFVIGAICPAVFIFKGVDGATIVSDMFISNGSSLMAVDLLLVAFCCIFWMVIEAKRLGMRWWAYLLASIFLPYCAVLPFFLFQREKMLMMNRLNDKSGIVS